VEEDRPAYDQAFRALLDAGRIQFEGRVRQPDGSIRWISISGRLFYNAKGKPDRAAGVISDITEQKFPTA
jgi:PAS domain S-box-containing protein